MPRPLGLLSPPFCLISCEHIVRWQHLSQIKDRLFWPVENVFSFTKTQQAKSGTSVATYKLMELIYFADRDLEIESEEPPFRSRERSMTSEFRSRKISDNSYLSQQRRFPTSASAAQLPKHASVTSIADEDELFHSLEGLDETDLETIQV